MNLAHHRKNRGKTVVWFTPVKYIIHYRAIQIGFLRKCQSHIILVSLPDDDLSVMGWQITMMAQVADIPCYPLFREIYRFSSGSTWPADINQRI